MGNSAQVIITPFSVSCFSDKKPLNVPDLKNLNFSTTIDTILQIYRSHPIILNIRNTLNKQISFSFAEVTSLDVLELIRPINIKKVSGEDQILPRLVNTIVHFLVRLVTDIKKHCLNTSSVSDLVHDPNIPVTSLEKVL